MKIHTLLRTSACLAATLLTHAMFAEATGLPPAVKVHVELDRDCLPAGREEKAVVKIGLGGLELARPEQRPPVNLALVIDRSGSMSGEKMSRAKEAALVALGRLGPEDVLSLVAYDTEVETLVPAMKVGDGERVAHAIRSLRANGNTALFAGVTQGAAEVRKHAESLRYSDRIILLSDGLANVGPSSSEDLARLGGALMKEGISVTTIGLGLGFNEDLMTRLAQRSDGNTYFVESSADLPRIFSAELGDVLNIVARRVVVRVQFPDTVRPRALVGREGRIDGQVVEVQLNQIYGGQEKFALIEVDVDPGKEGSVLKLADAVVTYEDAVTQRSYTVSSSRSVTFSKNEEAVVLSANHSVQADYARNVLALAKDRAVALADENRREEAAEEIRVKSARLNSMAAAYGNQAILEVTRQSAAEADRIEKEGLDNVSRKAYRAESVQVKSQQYSR